jgi:hypothetical protein
MSHAYNARKKARKRAVAAAIPIIPALKRLIRSGRVSRWTWVAHQGRHFGYMIHYPNGFKEWRKGPKIIDGLREQVREWLLAKAADAKS